MRAHTYDRIHRETERFEYSLRSVFVSAGSLVLTVLTLVILFFGVFLSRTN